MWSNKTENIPKENYSQPNGDEQTSLSSMNKKYQLRKDRRTSIVWQTLINASEGFALWIIKFPLDIYRWKDMMSGKLLTVLDRTTKWLAWTWRVTTYTIGLQSIIWWEINENNIKIGGIAYIWWWIFFIFNSSLPERHKYKDFKEEN